MNYGGHLVGGLGLSIGCACLARQYDIPLEPISFVVTGTLTSLLPDIDHPKSFVGRRFPILSKIIYKTVGHRTLTHSILFLLVVSSMVFPIHKSVGAGLFVGIGSHILLDTLKPFSKGCAIFYPFSREKVGFLRK